MKLGWQYNRSPPGLQRGISCKKNIFNINISMLHDLMGSSKISQDIASLSCRYANRRRRLNACGYIISETYALTHHRKIKLNPVRADTVHRPVIPSPKSGGRKSIENYVNSLNMWPRARNWLILLLTHAIGLPCGPSRQQHSITPDAHPFPG